METYPQTSTCWERFISFCRKHRAWIIGSLLPTLLLAAYNWYLEDMKLRVVPDIITREEVCELVAGKNALYAEGGYLDRRKMNAQYDTWVNGGRDFAWDLDNDGEPDMYVEFMHLPNREDGHFSVISGIERNCLFERLFHPERAAIQSAGFAIETQTDELFVVLYNTEDASPERFRVIIEDMLAEVRSAKGAP